MVGPATRQRQLPLLAVQLLPPLTRLGAGAAVSLFVLYLLGWLVHGVFWGELQAVDQQVDGAIAPWRTPDGLRAARWVSGLADLGLVIAAGAVALLAALVDPSRRSRGLTIVVTLLGGAILITGTKALLGRDRPVSEVLTVGAAFPSGHSFFALCLYGMVAHLVARRTAHPAAKVGIWSFALLIVLAVGASRIYLGAHWLTDVAAGYLVAVPWVVGVVTARDWLLGRRRGPTRQEVERAEALLTRAAAQRPAVARLSRSLLRDPTIRGPRRALPFLLRVVVAPRPFPLPVWLPLPRDADRMALAAALLLLSERLLGSQTLRAHWDGEGDWLLPVARIRHAIRLLLGRRKPPSRLSGPGRTGREQNGRDSRQRTGSKPAPEP